MILSPSGELVAVNESFSRMHGYSSEEMQTLNIRDLDTPETFRSVPERMQYILSGKSAIFEVEHYHKDGHVFPLEVSASLIVSDGKPLIQSLHRDITERKQAEAERALLEAQLRETQKMEAIGDLAGGIAREFNNAVAAILGNLELAREDLIANPPALESLDEIRKAGIRARNLVQQILAFSRRHPTELRPISLAAAVEQSVSLLHSALPANMILDVHYEIDVPAVMADATQIEQVVLNLATNAMQAMHGLPGHIGIRLDSVLLDSALADAHPELRAMHAKRPGLTARLAVSDDGPGMDSATLARIFEPFFSTRKGDEATGMGLAVVHGIVQEHAGAIVVDSRPGKGSTFTLYLSRAREHAEAPPPPPRAAAAYPVPVPAADIDAQRILYIDDDEALVFLMQRLLERRGFRISGYSDQREALAALRARPDAFDLVVSDYNMPGMSGLDVAREVRAIRADLPLAIASGFIDEQLRAEAPAAGVRELIFKADAAEGLCEALVRLAHTLGEKSSG
jgi:PAS domain S-box-containing protein